MQEDIDNKLRVSHELRAETAVRPPLLLLEAPNSTCIQKKHVGAINTAVCLPVLPKPYLRISVHKRLPTPHRSGGRLSKDKWMSKYIAMTGEKCRN